MCGRIGRCALQAMLYEAAATPKPGLVDRLNQGAHTDMDFFSFMASASALAPCFIRCAEQGAACRPEEADRLFSSLRPIGLRAERAMYEVTGGVNTHKGLIFSLGLISAAAAHVWAGGGRPDADAVCRRVRLMTRGLCERELGAVRDGGTHGERVFIQYGAKGIRGEAEAGFPTVRGHALPVLGRLLAERRPLNDALVQTLLVLMSANDDTNVLARHDQDTLLYVKKRAALALKSGGALTDDGRAAVCEMDRDFIARNISPGGSADLLAVTVMLDLVEKMEPCRP